jgi:hypothetical protein
MCRATVSLSSADLSATQNKSPGLIDPDTGKPAPGTPYRVVFSKRQIVRLPFGATKVAPGAAHGATNACGYTGIFRLNSKKDRGHALNRIVGDVDGGYASNFYDGTVVSGKLDAAGSTPISLQKRQAKSRSYLTLINKKAK